MNNAHHDTPTGTGLKSRLLKGTGAQAFGQAVQVFIRLAEVPLLLGFWGTQLYGEWLMLSAIPAYLAIADGGFAGAACRDMTMRAGAGDRKGALAVFQSTWVLLFAVSVATVFLALAFVNLAPLTEWLGFSAMTEAQTGLVFLLLVGHVLVGFQGGLLNGGFWVAGRYPLGMGLAAVTQLLEFAGLATAVLLGGGPVQAALGYLGGRACGTLLMWIGQRGVSPWLRHGFSKARLSELKRLTAPAFASLAFPLGNALNIQGMRLVIGLVLGPSAVALFVPLRTLSNLAVQPRAVINRLIQPELGLAFGAGDFSLFKRLFVKSCQLAFWGCLAASLVVAISGRWVLPVWTGGKIPLHWPAFILLLVGVLINGIWYTALMVPYATNRHGRIAVFYTLVYGGLAFGLGYLAASSLELTGAALALLLAEAAMAIFVIGDAIEIAQIDTAEWVRPLLRPPFDTVGQAAVELRRWVKAQ